MMKKKILVLCTGNSCRSQLAEGYLRHFAGERAEVYSAGEAKEQKCIVPELKHMA